MFVRKDLTGQTFNMITVMGYSRTTGTGQRKRALWWGRCECGSVKEYRTDILKDPRYVSCGCFNKIKPVNSPKFEYKHGDAKTKQYHQWASMKDRCKNPNNRNYKHYGGRGITYHPEWERWENFKAWMLSSGYEDGLTLERINVDGNYEPSNCCWITKSEQTNNTRRTVLYSYNGVTQNINQWAKTLGVNKNTLWYGLRKRNLTIEEFIKEKGLEV